MKRNTVIGLILGAGLLLTGTTAFAHWDDHGYRGDRGQGYGCGSGIVRTCYRFDERASAKDRSFCPAHRYGERHWRSDDGRYGHRNGRMEHRGRS